MTDTVLRKDLKINFSDLFKLSNELCNSREQIGLEISSEENKQLNKVKKWSNIVNSADFLIN